MPALYWLEARSTIPQVQFTIPDEDVQSPRNNKRPVNVLVISLVKLTRTAMFENHSDFEGHIMSFATCSEARPGSLLAVSRRK